MSTKRGIVASKPGISANKTLSITERSWSSEDESLTKILELQGEAVVNTTGDLTGTVTLYHNLGFFPASTGVCRAIWVGGAFGIQSFDTGWRKMPSSFSIYNSSDGGFYNVSTSLTIYNDRVEVFYSMNFTPAVPMAIPENPPDGPMTMDIRVSCYSLELGS